MPPPPPTPWSSQSRRGGGGSSGSFPSDRIPPPKQQQKQQKSGSSSSKQEPQYPVSPAVHALQTLISHLQNPPPLPVATTTAITKKVSKSSSSNNNNNEDFRGCFCQARRHPLSPYVPQCTSCGLVLCARNPPYEPCPFTSGGCGLPLLDPTMRAALVDRLRAQVAQTLAEEEAARRREEEARVRAAGAFPELGGGGAGGLGGIGMSKSASNSRTNLLAAPQPIQTHKVLSLSSKGTVKVTQITRTTSASPSPSPSPGPGYKPKTDPNEGRVPPPPRPGHGPGYVRLAPHELARLRRFEDVHGAGGAVYVPAPREERARTPTGDGPTGTGTGTKRKKRGKKKKPHQQLLLEGKENLQPDPGPSANE